MKYAAIVLVNRMNSLSAVEFTPVTDAFLSGGVPLDEVLFLPYDSPMQISSALVRCGDLCDGVFLIAESILLPTARRIIEETVGEKFSEEYLLETEKCLFGVLPAKEDGKKLVLGETVPRIDARRKMRYARLVLCTVLAPAEILRRAVESAREAAGEGVEIHLFERYGVCRIELLYPDTAPKMAVDEAMRILATELSEFVYSDRDESVAARLVDALKLRKKRISVAESFTGGGIARAITRIPGASAVYFEGINAYNALAKEERLGVSSLTIRRQGTVSDDTAYEMAAGLLKTGNCDLAVATTGVAGPDPDEMGNPVGLCYIAVGTKEQIDVFRFRLTGDRETISETAINIALFRAFRKLR